MIAVLADDAERAVVSEFFELFKTPWEFYRSDLQYDVLICSRAQFRNSSAKLVLIYGDGHRGFDRENGIEILSQRSDAVLSYKGDRIPIYGNCLTFKGAGIVALVEEQTGESTGLEIASREQKFLRLGFDLFEQIRLLLTHGQPSIHAHIPTLDLHIALLRDLITTRSIPLVEITPVPAGYNFIACLTHDIDHAGIRNHKWDHTMLGFLYRALVGSLINFCRGRRSIRQLAVNWFAAFSLPFVYLGLAKDFWNQFDRYIDIENGLTSTFFVIPKKGDPGQNSEGPAPSRRAARYGLEEIGPQLHRLISARREMALHGIDAWHDAARGRTELEAIRRVTGGSDVGVRMHWLFFNERSPATLEKAGFSYDSTMGYNETIGYRAGTTQVFKPLGVERMLELPMHIMDTALFFPGYMNLSPKDARDVVGGLVKNATRFGGVLTVNWHDRSIAPERLWDESYIELLEDLKTKEPWFSTATEAVSWFKKRRSAVVETMIGDGKTMRVKVSLNRNSDDLPGLRIRIHNAAAQRTHLSTPADSETQVAEMILNRSEEMEISL